jgi:hypothetical protein
MARPGTLGALVRDWRLRSYGIALLLPLALALLQQDLWLLLFVLIAPAIAVSVVVLLVCAMWANGRRTCLLILGAFAVFVATSALALAHANAIRATARWLFWSKGYKAKVLASPVPPGEQLKHIEWDGWGMFGMDQTVYLVFDPTDRLLAGAMRERPGRLAGIPCQVLQAQRLESCWYSVLFYTGDDWNGLQPMSRN